MKKLEKGFTLVELMIVVAIIAILAAVALPSFGQQIKKARDGKAVQMMGTMRSQLGMVIADLGGENPSTGTVGSVFTGGNITGDAAQAAATASSKGIDGFGKLATWNGTSGTIKAGTPASVTPTYAITNEVGTLSFTTAGNDTKGTAWTSY